MIAYRKIYVDGVEYNSSGEAAAALSTDKHLVRPPDVCRAIRNRWTLHGHVIEGGEMPVRERVEELQREVRPFPRIERGSGPLLWHPQCNRGW